MTNEVDNVLKEVENQTKKFGGLRNLGNHNYAFGDPLDSIAFNFIEIVDFINRDDLSPEKLAEDFIQEKIRNKYVYLSGLDEQKIKPRVFKGPLDERYEIGQNIFGGAYKIKYYLMGEFIDELVDKVVLDFIGVTKEKFLNKAKKSKTKQGKIIMCKSDGALVLKEGGKDILDDILEPRFFDRIAERLDWEPFICLFNGFRSGTAFKWSAISSIVKREDLGSDASKIRKAAVIVFNLNHSINHVFYYNPSERKCFNIKDTEIIPSNLTSRGVLAPDFNALMERLGGLY